MSAKIDQKNKKQGTEGKVEHIRVARQWKEFRNGEEWSRKAWGR